MAGLTIPPSEVRTLRKLGELPEGVFSKLLRALENIDAKSLRIETADHMAKSLSEISSSDLQDFLNTIYSLYGLKNAKGLPATEVATSIADTLASDKPQVFDSAKADLIKHRLTQILGIGRTLDLTAKSLDVMTEQSRTLLDARIVSDIRPVFECSPGSISAVMIIHNLNIHYLENGEHQEFFVALNTSDVRKLRATMERAEKKAETLQAFIAKSGIPYFEDRG